MLDVYSEMAGLVYGIPSSEVTQEQRNEVKKKV